MREFKFIKQYGMWNEGDIVDLDNKSEATQKLIEREYIIAN